jgi:RNA polymerase-binding transcription factor DksA
MYEKTADEIERAANLTTEMEEASVRAIRNAASKIPAGEPGECEYCGEYFIRLVNGACGRCRDKLKMP